MIELDLGSFLKLDYWTIIVLFGIVFWIFVWFAVILMLILYQYDNIRKAQAKNKVEPALSNIVHEIMFMDPENDVVNLKLKDKGLHISNAFEYDAIRNMLKEYYQLLMDPYRGYIVRIFKENKLNKLSIAKLKGRFLFSKDILPIISDLNMMREPIPDELVHRLLLHRNPQVVRAIREHLVHLKAGNAISLILDDAKELSRLDALELFESFKALKVDKDFRFYRYLDINNNINLNVLLLDLTVNFHEYDSSLELMELFQKGSEELKIKTVNSIGKLMLFETEKVLIAEYEKQSDDVKVEILKALGRLSTGSAIPFLKENFNNLELPVHFRKHALRSIIALAKNAPGIMAELEAKAVGDNLQLIRFIQHPLIKYI